MIPSVMRCHPAYPEQDYWRGRIWAPMNYLVYLAAKQHGLPELCKDLARKSRDLFLKECINDDTRKNHDRQRSKHPGIIIGESLIEICQ